MGLIEDEQAARAAETSAGTSSAQGQHADAADQYRSAGRLWHGVAEKYRNDEDTAEQAGNGAEACRCRCAAAVAFEAAARAYLDSAAEFRADGKAADAADMDANAETYYESAAPLFEACGKCQSNHGRAWVAYAHARACWALVRARSAARADKKYELSKKADTEAQRDEAWEVYKLEKAKKEKAARGEKRAKAAEADERDATRE